MADINIVEGLIVQPGDTLLVRLDPDRASAAYVDEMRERLAEYLPDGVRVVIVAADGFALAVREDTGRCGLVCDLLIPESPIHIAANDPDAVLRLIASLRKIMDAHVPERRRVTFSDDAGTTSWGDLVCLTCYRQEVPRGTDPWWPCPTVRALANGLGIDTEES